MIHSELDRQLAELKATIATIEPPPEVDAAIAAAIARKRAPLRMTLRDRSWLTPARMGWFAAIAATIAFVAVFHRGETPLVGPVLDAGTTSANSRDSGYFLPVVPRDELAEATDAMVISARVPRMALAQFGLPVNPADATDGVETELLVRGDGAVLAFRFVQ